MKLFFKKSATGLTPADETTNDWLIKVKAGAVVSGEFKKPRSYQFHRKYFALLKVAFDNWEPNEIQVEVAGKMITPEKNFDRFRKDLTILCGHYDTVFRLDNTFRIEPKSISFGNMSSEEFDKFYQTTITVLINQMWQSLDTKDVEAMVEAYLGFA